MERTDDRNGHEAAHSQNSMLRSAEEEAVEAVNVGGKKFRWSDLNWQRNLLKNGGFR